MAHTKKASSVAEHKTKKITVKDWHKNNPGYEYLKPGFKAKLDDDYNLSIEILRTTVSMTHAFGLDDDGKAFVTKVPQGQLRMQVRFLKNDKETDEEFRDKLQLYSDRFFLDIEKHQIWNFDTFKHWGENGKILTQGEMELEENIIDLPN